jgi:hypothetical protein
MFDALNFKLFFFLILKIKNIKKRFKKCYQRLIIIMRRAATNIPPLFFGQYLLTLQSIRESTADAEERFSVHAFLRREFAHAFHCIYFHFRGETQTHVDLLSLVVFCSSFVNQTIQKQYQFGHSFSLAVDFHSDHESPCFDSI